jgi:hypothetical protein
MYVRKVPADPIKDPVMGFDNRNLTATLLSVKVAIVGVEEFKWKLELLKEVF